MKHLMLALVLFLVFGAVAWAAPGVPYLFNLWTDQAVGTTPITYSLTLENTTVGHIYYHFSSGYTGTFTVTVAEGFDGETLFSQGAVGTTDGSTEASGVITLTMICPDITVSVVGDANGESTVGVWQR